MADRQRRNFLRLRSLDQLGAACSPAASQLTSEVSMTEETNIAPAAGKPGAGAAQPTPEFEAQAAEVGGAEPAVPRRRGQGFQPGVSCLGDDVIGG